MIYLIKTFIKNVIRKGERGRKERSMKRIVSCLLAFVLIFTPYFSATASEPEQSTVRGAQGSNVTPDGQKESRGEGTEEGKTKEQGFICGILDMP